jgi:ATP-dependent RNA helicase DDX47/RRP3
MPALKKRKISHEKIAEKEEVSEDASSSQEEVQDNAEQDEAAKAPKAFKDLGLIPQLCEACETLGYKAPTAIQAESIPLALQVFLSLPLS